jgi:hypothetical protein
MATNGAIIGAVSGFIVGIVLLELGLLVVVSLTIFATAAGCVGGFWGWRVGVAAFAISHTSAIILMITVAMLKLAACTKTTKSAQEVSENR